MRGDVRLPSAVADVTKELQRLAAGPGARSDKTRRAASVIRAAGGYRWVGLYDVEPETVTQGLNGAAVASGEAVRAGPGGAVLGTIDVESDRPNLFGERDRELLGACAGALAGLWLGDPTGC